MSVPGGATAGEAWRVANHRLAGLRVTAEGGPGCSGR